MHKRMALTFKTAAKAIAVTSSTTSVAFAANALSPIPPIKAFGLHASMVVLVNFCLTVTVMPSVMAVYERNLRGKCARCCVCCLKCRRKPEQKSTQP